MPDTASYETVEDLLADREGESIHLECRRETVRSYLRLFSRLAGGAVAPEDAMAHFGLAPAARVQVKNLTNEQRALLNFARMSLSEPEVVFCERPLADVTPVTRGLVTAWMG